VREEDRIRVARDLHDQIGQILTSIKMDLTWMTRHLPESGGVVIARLKESIQLINNGVKTVRTICSGLRPGLLDDLGLAAAIEWQASEFATRNGVPCQVSVPLVDQHLNGARAVKPVSSAFIPMIASRRCFSCLLTASLRIVGRWSADCTTCRTVEMA
jgi:signal transduction histidine kinase